MASTARCCRPPRDAGFPSTTACSGPRIPNSTLIGRTYSAGWSASSGFERAERRIRARYCSGCGLTRPRRLAREAFERHLRVSELLWIDLGAGPDQVANLLVDVPDVDVHPGGDPAVLHPEGDELSRVHVAPEDDLVPVGRE